MTVNDILQAMDTIAPFRLTMDFDNTGLLIGDPNAAVTGVVLALDCTDEVIETAKARNANLIITHHPVIFHGIKHVRADSVVYQVIRNDMHVISAHTNLDIAEGGVNDCFAAELELTQLCGLTATDDEHSLGRVGSLTAEENKSHFSLWCMMAAPLILGNDARKFLDENGEVIKDDKVLSILKNKALIDIDQDKRGIQAKRIKTDGITDILVKPLENRELAVCFLNKSSTQKKISLSFQSIHNDPYVDLPIVDEYEVTELWDNVTLTLKNEITGIVPAHGVKVYRVKVKEG